MSSPDTCPIAGWYTAGEAPSSVSYSSIEKQIAGIQLLLGASVCVLALQGEKKKNLFYGTH